MRPHRRRRQTPRHLPLNLILDPPPGTVPREQDLGSELLEILHRGRDLRLTERASEVVAADDGVKQRWREAAGEVQCVLGRVDDAGVTAACEDDGAFACIL